MKKTHLTTALVLAAAFGFAQAKLPPPTEDQKVKAEEAKAKAAEAAKRDAAALTKAQDDVAARYIKVMKEKGVTITPVPIAAATAPGAAPAAPAAAPAAPAAAPAAPAAAAPANAAAAPSAPPATGQEQKK